jgi:predicted LPLAT superfamily acyltransferase
MMEELKHQQVKMKRLVYAMGAVMVTGLVMFIIVVVYIVLSSQGNRASTCDVVRTQQHSLEAQIQAYQETPPTTDAGRNIVNRTVESKRAWDHLAQTLNCKENQ